MTLTLSPDDGPLFTFQILIPLLLQDKLNVIEKYLSKSPRQQVQFVQHVEKICSQDVSVLSYME